MKLLALALLAGATPAQQQFNLVCTGTVETLYGASKTVEPYRTTYRVDLSAGRWCDGKCGATRPIHDIQPNILVLEAPRDTSTPSERNNYSGYIGRISGHYHAVSDTISRDLGHRTLTWGGQCEKAPFTGFPAATTKF